MTFKFEKLNIPEIISIQPQVFSDKRGFFFESFKESEFIINGISFATERVSSLISKSI